MQSLSIIVITKNEERSIERCLRSVTFASERIVVDSGSTDRTVEIARALGARVVETSDWPGYGLQKRRALDLATGDWVLSLDADEWIAAEHGALIRSAIDAPDPPSAYRTLRKSRFCGRKLRFGGWSSDYVVRLFRRGKAEFSDDLVHEGLNVYGPIRQLDIVIEHDSIDSWDDACLKIESYSKAAAQQLFERGKRAMAFVAPLHGLAAFLKVYVLRLGFLDGAAGFGVARYSSLYATAKWRLLAELSTKAPERTSAENGASGLFMTYRIDRAARRTGYFALLTLAIFMSASLYSLLHKIITGQPLLH